MRTRRKYSPEFKREAVEMTRSWLRYGPLRPTFVWV
jgi:hypothetical protein